MHTSKHRKISRFIIDNRYIVRYNITKLRKLP
nr:MAG TPA: hypothetical protein [Caudoviricetes sp.]